MNTRSARMTLVLTCAAGAAIAADASSLLMHASEFRVSTFRPSSQEQASIAVAPDGSITAVWQSRRQREGRAGVYMQRFDASGVALGSETSLALWDNTHAASPVAAAAADSSVWAAWQSYNQDGWMGSIIARRFDPSGVGADEILVNACTEGEQINPVLATLPDAGAAIAWETTAPHTATRVALRVLNPDGSPRTGELDAGSLDGARLATPSIAVNADGTIALAYAAFDAASGEPLGVFVRLFNPAGEPLSDAVQVSTPGASTPVEPAIAATADGFVVAWQDVLDEAHSYDVLARRLDASGSPLCEPELVNTIRAGTQNAAAVAVGSSGAISIAYNARDDSGLGVFVRHFASDLRPLTDAERLTIHTKGNQGMREALATQRLAYSPSGALACVWQGDAGFGDDSSVNVTLHTPRPLTLGARTQGILPGMTPAAHIPLSIAAAGAPQPHEPPTFDPRAIDSAAHEIVTDSRGIGFTGIVNTGWTPPDPHMAVGPNHVVVMTNGAIAFFTKTGTKTFQDEIEDSFGFWGSVGATGFVFDPEVIYDTSSDRFFAMAAEGFEPGGTSHVLVAVSDNSDPNGTWFKYRFDTTAFAGDLFDSPNIGVTENALIITGDGFGFSSNYPCYIFDKASLLVGNPPAITKSFLLTTSTQSAGYPRVTTGTGDTVYLLEHKEGATNTTIRVLAFRNILSTPTVADFTLTVPSYGPPEDPPQMGSSSRPNTFDARFWSVDQGPDGHIWGTHHINASRVLARWYEVDLRGWPTSGNNPVLVQSGNVDLGSTVRTFFSSINVSDDGSAAICYARSSPTEFISMATSYRRDCDAAGTLFASAIHKSSNAAYTAGRWGDYSGVQFDPAAPATYWAHHEWSENGSWRTWIQSVDTQLCFCPGDFNQDGTTNTLDVTAFLNAWAAGNSSADWNNDGTVNTLDVLAFLNDWAACRD